MSDTVVPVTATISAGPAPMPGRVESRAAPEAARMSRSAAEADEPLRGRNGWPWPGLTAASVRAARAGRAPEPAPSRS